MGTQAIAARRFAEKKPLDAGAVLTNSWFFAAAAGAVFTALGYAALPAVLSLMIKVPDVRAAAEAYLEWRLLGIASMVITFRSRRFRRDRPHLRHMVSANRDEPHQHRALHRVHLRQLGRAAHGHAGAGLAWFVSTWVGLAIMIGWALRAVPPGAPPYDLRNLSRGLTWDIQVSIQRCSDGAVMSGFGLFP